VPLNHTKGNLRVTEIGAFYASPPTVKDALADPAGLAAVVVDLIALQTQETLAAVYLDRYKRLIAVERVYRGTAHATQLSTRDILAHALVLPNCAAIAVAHNHPSGSLEPSKEDLAYTGRLRAACELMGLTLLDHLIVNASGEWVSLGTKGAKTSWHGIQ
jgi:DNA repair protein RadC